MGARSRITALAHRLPLHGPQKVNYKEPSMTNLTEMALEEHWRTSALAERRTPRRLTSEWYKDANGVLAIRWVIEGEPDERRSPAALAA